MAQTDNKPLSEFPLFNNSLDANSLVAMTVNPSGSSNITRKVYLPALKNFIAGYELIGTLTAGSTSITLSSAGTTYNEQTAYTVGQRVTYTGDDEVTRSYICVKACTAANWETNGKCFVEYKPIDSNSTFDIYTSTGLEWNTFSISNNAITLAFDSQVSDVGVKVRVS